MMKGLDETYLSERERKVVHEAVLILKGQFPVEKAILFGSKARGDHDEHSDIDLLVITSRLLHWREEKAVVETLFDIGMEHDVIFSPLFVSSLEWHKGSFTQLPIYWQIVEEGAVVA